MLDFINNRMHTITVISRRDRQRARISFIQINLLHFFNINYDYYPHTRTSMTVIRFSMYSEKVSSEVFFII